ncbi:MAG: TIGR01906 family membrane protein [Chloroflexota bacterium]|nr:TIGR01906 family membrane protein [Chloroflexota bacterium]
MHSFSSDIPRWLGLFLNICVIVTVPVSIISGTVIVAFNNDTTYEQGFNRYNISARTGISTNDLSIVASELQDYFNNNEEFLSIRTIINGESTALFNGREIEHMRDVKGLVRGVYWIFSICALYLVISLIISILPMYAAWRLLLKLMLYGSLLTIGIISIFGLASLSGFDALFLKFHQLSFSNDLWQLNPHTDYLIMMFPAGFWFDSAIKVSLTTLSSAGILATLTGSFFAYNKLKTVYGQ